MRSPPPAPTPPEGEFEKVIFNELMIARAQNRAVSRHMLTQKLHLEKGLHPKEAFAVVDLYCDDSAPSTPEYLGTEFMVPFLKMSACLFALISILVMGYSASQINHGKPLWWWGLGVGTLFLAIAANGWIRSLLRELKKPEAVEAKQIVGGGG